MFLIKAPNIKEIAKAKVEDVSHGYKEIRHYFSTESDRW